MQRQQRCAVDHLLTTDLATERIREFNHYCVLWAGERIRMGNRATDLGTNLTSARDALGRLESQYVVETVPCVGVYLRDTAVDKTLEMCCLRQAIDRLVAPWLSERSTIEERAALPLPLCRAGIADHQVLGLRGARVAAAVVSTRKRRFPLVATLSGGMCQHASA